MVQQGSRNPPRPLIVPAVNIPVSLGKLLSARAKIAQLELWVSLAKRVPKLRTIVNLADPVNTSELAPVRAFPVLHVQVVVFKTNVVKSTAKVVPLGTIKAKRPMHFAGTFEFFFNTAHKYVWTLTLSFLFFFAVNVPLVCTCPPHKH